MTHPALAPASGPAVATRDGRPGPANALEKLLSLTDATPFTATGITLVPTARSRAIYVPMVCDLGLTSVEQAVQDATTFITRLDLYPGSTKKLFKTYRRIAAWCAEHDIELLADLVDDTAAQLIRDVAKLDDLACTVRPAKPQAGKGKQALTEARAAAYTLRLRAHRVRNALISLRSATVLTHTRHRSQRTVTDTLAFGLPALPDLEDRKGRPLTDEEVLLARFLVHIDAREEEQPRGLLAYLIAESGIRPIESTELDTDNLDDRHAPTRITAKGAWDFGSRTVKLDPYVAATMPAQLARLRAGTQPMTYTGGQPGETASTASLGLQLLRRLRRAGITDTHVTAKSLNLWRVMHTLVRTENMAKARRIHGGGTINVLEDLKLDLNEDDLSSGSVHLHRRDTNQHVVSMPSKHFYDGSITKKGNRKKPGMTGDRASNKR